MPPQADVENLRKSTTGLAKQRTHTLRRHESVLVLQPNPTIYQTTDAEQEDPTLERVIPTPEVPLEKVTKCKDLWFEDGDVIIWAQSQNSSMLYRVHRRVLKESDAEPFCTVVDCDYPNPETSDEIFLDGIWVLKYAEQDPIDIMYLLKWMYERP